MKVHLEVRKEPNATYIEGYNGTLLDPNKIKVASEDDDNVLHLGNPSIDDGDDDVDNSNNNNNNINNNDVNDVDNLANSDSVSSMSSFPSSSSSFSEKRANNNKKNKDVTLSLTCTTESAKPPVRHSWFKINGESQEQLTPVTSEIIEVNEITGVKTTKSMVQLNLSARDQVRCHFFSSRDHHILAPECKCWNVIFIKNSDNDLINIEQ